MIIDLIELDIILISNAKILVRLFLAHKLKRVNQY